jgi:hypothetical protein
MISSNNDSTAAPFPFFAINPGLTPRVIDISPLPGQGVLCKNSSNYQIVRVGATLSDPAAQTTTVIVIAS